ncbi:MAG TPA: BamA/TamA family outer membrane protein [Candidatus Fermentibacter daniensis]|nr:BamA/TamA family outer membrane protein [Candidatus Fermentibacter daniensis]
MLTGPALTLALALSAAPGASSGAVVDSICIEGAGAVSEGDLLEGSGLRRGVSLMEVTPGEVRQAVLSNLNNRGYLEASVEVAWPEWHEDVGVVRITVSPGRRSLMGPLVLSGNQALEARELLRAVDIEAGRVLTPGALEQIRSAMLERYARHGYVLASVDVAVLPFDASAPESLPAQRGVECSISEGRQILLGSMDVEGLRTVRKVVVTREVLLQPGDSLDMEMMRRSIAAIYDLALFSDVRFVYEGLSEGRDSVDLLIQVTERPYRELDLGAGYASPSAMILSAFWKHPNIMGNNQSLTIGSEWTRYFSTGGGDIVEPSLVYEEPYVASTKWKGRFTLSYLYFSLPGLDERGYGGEIAISRFLAEKLKLTLSYSLSRNKYNETGVGGGEEEFDWTTTSRVSAGIQHDTRDAVLDPRHGHLLGLSGGLSGGFLGGRSFYRIESEARVFKPVIRDVILAWRIRGGVVRPYGEDEEIAPGERFFLGGGSTIRGYAFNTVGPEDSEGNPTGGRVMLLGNIESRMRVVGGLWMALFLDTGGIWEEVDQISTETAGLGVGMGLRFATPFGPLRLDYGFAPTWTDGLRRGRAYLALGHPF